MQGSHHPISFQSIQRQSPDKFYYLKDKIQKINDSVSRALQEIYHSLISTLSFDQIPFHRFRKIIWPLVASGAALLIGEYTTKRLSQYYTEDEKNDFIFKFLLGVAMITYSASHRLTDKSIEKEPLLSAVIASEVASIIYLYQSVFQASEKILEEMLPPQYALVSSLSLSTFIVPVSLSYFVEKYQASNIKKHLKEGAQRSDTAIISSGLSPIANTYFAFNHFLLSEIMTVSRLFQLVMIYDNIINSKILFQQFRNLPALLADMGPSLIKTLINQKEKIEKDYHYNTAYEKVLRSDLKAISYRKRQDLRNGDLVYLDKNNGVHVSFITGEIIALKSVACGFPPERMEKKCSINLKAHTGENIWMERKTQISEGSEDNIIHLDEIRKGNKVGVLVGDKFNLHNENNFFIRVMRENKTSQASYTKKSVINDIIASHKKQCVIYAMASSFLLAGFLENNIRYFPGTFIQILFYLFQMMIPFSESFLREMVNSQLMKKINQNLAGMEMETIDALRMVDFCNALGEYYSSKFHNGIALLSDKTGTLTTSQMNMVGIWHVALPQLKECDQYPLCFEVFFSAYTNRKNDEPEEWEILQYFKTLFGKKLFTEVSILEEGHFLKIFSLDGPKKMVETFHLGLYRSMGGRLTIVADTDKYYLIFLGIPKEQSFKGTPLFTTYWSMPSRKGVLSRDWCIARTEISKNKFMTLRKFFHEDNKESIKKFLLNEHKIFDYLIHYGTFLINNPLKPGVEKWIESWRHLPAPVFIATGDTLKSAENIAKVVCSGYAPHSILIFSRIDHRTFLFLNRLIYLGEIYGKIIIFCEMSAKDKEVLAEFLKTNEFFVVVNGDGTNDVLMMEKGHTVLAHVNKKGEYAPGVAQYADINDKQLPRLFQSKNSFYELCQIHSSCSTLIKKFGALANSQEKPSIALLLKASKITFELAKAIGVSDVKEMAYQHWFGVVFDLLWLWIAFHEIMQTIHLPMDNKNLSDSYLALQCMMTTLIIAVCQSYLTYIISGESTNAFAMTLMLTFLPLVLKSLFHAFDEFHQKIPDEFIKKSEKSLKTQGFFKKHRPSAIIPEALRFEAESRTIPKLA